MSAQETVELIFVQFEVGIQERFHQISDIGRSRQQSR